MFLRSGVLGIADLQPPSLSQGVGEGLKAGV